VLTIKANEPAVRVLVVEGDGLGQGTVEGILGTTAAGKAVRAASVTQARELWRGGGFDLVVAAETRFRDVLDGIFAFVGLFSTDGVVLDTNQAPLAAGGLLRGDVVGHRFVDLPWFSHSEIERARVSDAIARAARGESSRFETSVVSAKNGIVHIDAAFAPLPGPDGAITRVVGTGVDVTVRRKAENELRRSREAIAEAQRLARLGSWEWNVGTNQVVWSEELFRIYALDPARHVPTYDSFLATVHPDDREHTSTVLRLATENVSAFVYDHRIVRPDGSVRMLHTRGEVVPDREGRVARLVGSCWDITDRWEALRRAEKARTDAESARREMENILERVADGFVAVDRDCRYRYINESARRVLGRDPESLLGKLMWDEFPEVRGHAFQRACQQALAEQRPVHVWTYFQPWDRWFEGRIHPSPEGLSIFFTDVTEQQKAQENLRASAVQLRALAARLSEIREEERKSIARELHDQVGQALTALKLDLEWTRGQLDAGAPAEMRTRFAAMDALLDQTLDTTQRISATLRPAILDDLGLPAALRWQAAEFTQRTGVACQTRLPDADPSLAPATALALFRILQEALTNVARHAGAKNVRIGLTLEGSSAILTIADDGRGIAPDVLSRRTSLGLMGMRERALAFGGTLELSGEPGNGTTVTVCVPVGSPEMG
jgi:PAS domain S-box-containing protein